MKSLGLIIGLSMTWIPVMSQHALSGTEYWVVETHARDSVYSIVRFFSSDDRLMHELKIDHVIVDIQQKRTRKRLNQLLADYRARTTTIVKKMRSKLSA